MSSAARRPRIAVAALLGSALPVLTAAVISTPISAKLPILPLWEGVAWLLLKLTSFRGAITSTAYEISATAAGFSFLEQVAIGHLSFIVAVLIPFLAVLCLFARCDSFATLKVIPLNTSGRILTEQPSTGNFTKPISRVLLGLTECDSPLPKNEVQQCSLDHRNVTFKKTSP